MAKKKKEKEPEQEKEEAQQQSAPPSDFGHEIWGLIFLATGVLVFISLVSHFASAASNVLGQYFGTGLSAGLVYLFGPVPSFMIPAAICYIGVTRLIGMPLKLGMLLLLCALTIEVCAFLAIFHLPAVVQNPELAASSNNVGLFFVKMLSPIFGPHRFGPYFLSALLILITGLWGLRINPMQFFGLVWFLLKKVWQWSIIVFSHVKEQLKTPEPVRQLLPPKDPAAAQPADPDAEPEQEQTAEAEYKPKNKREKKEAKPVPVNGPVDEAAAEINEVPQDILPVETEADTVEEEARRRLEEELAAFRAKKHEPIKIMSIETAELPEEEADEMDEVAAMEETQLDSMPKGEDIEESSEPATAHLQPRQTKPYEIPSPDILPDPPALSNMIDKETIEKNSMILEKTLMNFGVEGKVVFVSPGPVVTRYEIELAPGIKISRIVNLHDDISMAVGGQRIRIEAPIPGKSAVGIELPNPERQIVYFKPVLLSEAFRKSKAKIPVVVGTNISGAPYVTDITKMPHVLIAGQTGSGKSVCINSLICSILMTKKPEELRLIMIDPKKVELSLYEGIPHLLSPVVTESKEAVKALQWGTIEMERRYRMLAKVGARNIDSFNSKVELGKLGGILPDEDNKQLPFIVIIVDELADLMMTASRDVEGLVQRIAQLARAVGIHLIVATQRPSVDIITGPIKANLTSRIAFRTIQSTDSRTILGYIGAEKLLGLGDMLFLRNGASEIERFHGSFISEEDVEKIVSNVRSQVVDIEKIESFHDATGGDDESGGDDNYDGGDDDRDALFEEAARIIVSIGQGSTSMLQRRMKIGYARAGRLMDELEKAGFVGPPDGSKAREVLVRPDELDQLLGR